MITPLETLAQTPHRKVAHCPVCGDSRNDGHILCYACWNSISDADQRGLKYGEFGHRRAILRRLLEYRTARLAALGILPSR